MPENTVKDAEGDVVYFDTTHDGGVLDPHNKNHGSVPRASGGTSTGRAISDGTTLSTLIKGAAGQVYSVTVANNSAVSSRYVKFYNKASAPTVGTDAPLFTIGVGPSDQFSFRCKAGIEFTLGIGYGFTTGIPDNDTSGIPANQVSVTIEYK